MKCWYYTKRQKEKMSTEAKKLVEKKIKEFMDLSLLTSPKEALEIMKEESEEKKNDIYESKDNIGSETRE